MRLVKFAALGALLGALGLLLTGLIVGSGEDFIDNSGGPSPAVMLEFAVYGLVGLTLGAAGGGAAHVITRAARPAQPKVHRYPWKRFAVGTALSLGGGAGYKMFRAIAEAPPGTDTSTLVYIFGGTLAVTAVVVYFASGIKR
jgi:hypothetical protein